MLFHFKDQFPALNRYWDRYLEYQKRMEVPAKSILLEEGRVSMHYIFIEKGCVRAAINSKGKDKTVQFFFENEGLSSLESFLGGKPSMFKIETIESSIVYMLHKRYVTMLIEELSREPDFVNILMQISAERQVHYMNEFFSFIRDSPEERYQNLIRDRPHIIRRVPQHYIASYLGITRVHLSRIKSGLAGKE